MLRDETCLYTKAEIGEIKYYNKVKYLDYVKTKTKSTLYKNSQLVESTILRKMIKYKSKYLLVKQKLID